MTKEVVDINLAGKVLFLSNTAKDVRASGVLLYGNKRILVKSGAKISSENRLPSQKGQASSASLRQKLIDEGVVVDGVFASDYTFASTSSAASVILGQSASGMTAWKDENGLKLGDLL